MDPEKGRQGRAGERKSNLPSVLERYILGPGPQAGLRLNPILNAPYVGSGGAGTSTQQGGEGHGHGGHGGGPPVASGSGGGGGGRGEMEVDEYRYTNRKAFPYPIKREGSTSSIPHGLDEDNPVPSSVRTDALEDGFAAREAYLFTEEDAHAEGHGHGRGTTAGRRLPSLRSVLGGVVGVGTSLVQSALRRGGGRRSREGRESEEGHCTPESGSDRQESSVSSGYRIEGGVGTEGEKGGRKSRGRGSKSKGKRRAETEEGEERAKSRKVELACIFCKSRKLKCNGELPTCWQCVKHQRECKYPEKQKRRGPGKNPKGSKRRSGGRKTHGEGSVPSGRTETPPGGPGGYTGVFEVGR